MTKSSLVIPATTALAQTLHLGSAGDADLVRRLEAASAIDWHTAF